MKDFKMLLLNPFPERLSPYAELVREKSDQWINEEYAGFSSSFREMLLKINPGYWAAYCWPDAPLPLLATFTRVLLWGVAYDDYYAPLPVEELSNVLDRTLEIARGDRPAPDENPLLHQFSTFMREFESCATEDWLNRYIYDLSQFFEGMKIDSARSYRKDVKYPSVKDYIAIRRMAVAAGSVCCKIELSTGILPEFIIMHPFLQKTKVLTSDLIGWGNDLVSVEKEKGDDEALNLVLVIKNELNCSIEHAFAEAIRMYNAHVEEYLLLYNDIPDFGAYTPSVRKYLDGQGLWLSGHLNWFNCTTRFKLADYQVNPL